MRACCCRPACGERASPAGQCACRHTKRRGRLQGGRSQASGGRGCDVNLPRTFKRLSSFPSCGLGFLVSVPWTAPGTLCSPVPTGLRMARTEPELACGSNPVLRAKLHGALPGAAQDTPQSQPALTLRGMHRRLVSVSRPAAESARRRTGSYPEQQLQLPPALRSSQRLCTCVYQDYRRAKHFAL